MNFSIRLKTPIETKRDLSLVYTPGVGECCIKIKENPETAMELTNKANSIAVLAYKKEHKKASEIAKKYLENGFSAYPIILDETKIDINYLAESLMPSFAYFDTSLIQEITSKKINTTIPQSSKKAEKLNKETLPPDTKEASLILHKTLNGVIEQTISSTPCKPVGVVSNGSAVLGFGNIGADAAMPVMEGKAALFKKFGEVDAIPVCIKANNIEDFKEITRAIAPSFFGINLEDICAPDCFETEQFLSENTTIPIFHDDQHGTAIIVLSALINATKLIEKSPNQTKIVFSGAGAAAIAVCKLLLAYGFSDITMCDIDGILYQGRPSNNPYLEEMAQKTNHQNLKGSLSDAIQDADVFIGLSAKDVLKKEMIQKMNKKPVVFALANPNPEIMPDIAKEAGAYIVATGRSDFPNQINNCLVFPGIFKGILKSGKKIITEEIKLITAKALASKVKAPSTENIVPDSLDMEVADIIADAICNA